MSFFKEIQEKLSSTLEDLSTIEHALILEKNATNHVSVYHYQQIDGDSVNYIQKNVDQESVEMFNQAVLSSVQSRNALRKFIIKTIK